MKTLQPVVELLGGILGPNVEIVLHDLAHPRRSVVAIANGHVSNRSVGSPILSGPRKDKAFALADSERSARGASCSIVHTYPTVTAGGKGLRSSTAVFRDSRGEPFAALCLNADMAMFEAAHAWLERLLNPRPVPTLVKAHVPDMDLLIEGVVNDAVRSCGKPVPLMSRDDKVQAIQTMMQRGLFVVRGGVGRAAKALAVSRFTVYNYMEQARRQSTLATADSTGRVVELPAALPAAARPRKVSRAAGSKR